MRWRLPKYHRGWLVWNPGGGGGSGTVQTDGVTIQGDGSAGNKIAIKAVQLTARLTGAGTVASPLDVAGWPIAYFAPPTPEGTGNFSVTVNTLDVYGIAIPYAVVASNISISVDVADGANNYDFGLYNAAGTRVAHTGAVSVGATGTVTIALTGAPITLAPALYFFAWTGNSATLVLKMGVNFAGGGQAPYGLSFNHGYSASVGGVLPASITPPAQSVTAACPIFLLS